MFSYPENPCNAEFPAALGISSIVDYTSKTQQMYFLEKTVRFFSKKPTLLVNTECARWEAQFRKVKGFLIFGNIQDARKRILGIELEEIAFEIRRFLRDDFILFNEGTGCVDSHFLKLVERLKEMCLEFKENYNDDPEN